MWPIFIKVPLHFHILLIYDFWGESRQEANVFRNKLTSVSAGLNQNFSYGAITHHPVAEKGWKAAVRHLTAATDVVATLAFTGDFVKITITALNLVRNPRSRHQLWVKELLVGPSEVFPAWILLDVWLRPGGRVTNFPWIRTSRGLSCSTTVSTNSLRTSRHRCASTRCQTLSTSSTRAWTAICRQGHLTASATSWVAPWWGWAPRAPPPCCRDTLPWGGSVPPSPARPCTITETTTPRWAASPSRAASAPPRLVEWAAGLRAAVTGEEGGSSAPTVSVSSAHWAQHPAHHSITTP